MTASLALGQASVSSGAGAEGAWRYEQSAPEVLRDRSGRVSVKLERGGRVNIDNRTTGPIVIIGWDRDVIEASATSDLGAEAVRVWIDALPGGARIWLKADYAEREGSEEWSETRQNERAGGARLRDRIGLPPLVQADIPLLSPVMRMAQESSSNFYSRPREIFLEVKVPRYAVIETIRVIRSSVLVSDIETAVVVSGSRSAVKLIRVGAAEVRTRSGEVEVEGVSDLVDVITTSGAIRVKNAGGDVRALSLSGAIEIECARGHVDVSNTDGPITLSGVGEHVSATSTYSNLRLSGAIHAGGRYYLKTMSGAVEMAIAPEIPGFTAALSSYQGEVETDFSLEPAAPASTGSPSRHLSVRYGNGQAQIILDSFDGPVRLMKLTEAERTRLRQRRCPVP